MKRKLLILGLMAAVFATLTACEKEKSNVHFIVYAGFPKLYTSGDLYFGTEGGSLKIPFAVFWSTDNTIYIGLERVVAPENIIFKIVGDGFDLDETLQSDIFGVRLIKLTADAYEGNVPRKCKLFITVSKGKTSKTYATEIIQYPSGVESPKENSPIVWEEINRF